MTHQTNTTDNAHQGLEQGRAACNELVLGDVRIDRATRRPFQPATRSDNRPLYVVVTGAGTSHQRIDAEFDDVNDAYAALDDYEPSQCADVMKRAGSGLTTEF